MKSSLSWVEVWNSLPALELPHTSPEVIETSQVASQLEMMGGAGRQKEQSISSGVTLHNYFIIHTTLPNYGNTQDATNRWEYGLSAYWVPNSWVSPEIKRKSHLPRKQQTPNQKTQKQMRRGVGLLCCQLLR